MADEQVKINPDFAQYEYEDPVEEVTNEGHEADPTEVTDPVEVEARKHGWKPLEEFHGDESSWRDAKNWLDRKSLFDRIDRDKRRIQEIETALRDLAEHNKKIAEVERKNIIKSLNEEKRLAYEHQDLDRVVEIDEQIIEAKTQPVVPPVKIPQASNNEEDPEFVEFVSKNSWYNENTDLREMANGVAMQYVAKANAEGRTITKQEVFNYVESKIKPFTKTEKVNYNPVTETGTRSTNTSSSRKSKYTYNDLDADTKKICDRFVRLGVFKSNQEYVDDFAKSGGFVE